MAKLKLRRREPGVPGPVKSADVPSRRVREAGGLPDPRWSLTPRGQLTPAMTYLLMTGEPPAVRLRGWVALAQGEPDVALMWQAYRGALIAEAQMSGFVPFWEDKKAPRGSGFEHWQRSFLAAHKY